MLLMLALGATIVYFATADHPKELTTAWGRPSTLFKQDPCKMFKPA